eukprot:jgi/Tetstr1/446305/TSEL_033849.t1
MEAATLTAGSYERFLFGYRAQPAAGGAAENGKPTLDRCFTYAAHQGSVKCVTAVGNFIASGGADDLIHVYDLNSGADLGFLMHPGYGAITCLDSFTPPESPVPTHLLSGGEDGVVNVWQAGGEWEHLQSMTGHKAAVSSVALHPSGRVAMSVGLDAGLRLWDLARGKTSYCSMLAARGEAVAWAQGGETYCLLMAGKLVARSIVGEGATLASFETPRRQISLLTDGDNTAVTGAEDGGLRVWDIATGSLKIEVPRAHGARVRAIVALPGGATTPDGFPAHLASASTDGVLKLWDVRMMGSGGRAACALAEVATTARLTCLAASPHPARLKEMAQAQAQADKAGEADKKRRLAQRLEAKAKAAAGQPTEGAKQQQNMFEVVPQEAPRGKKGSAKPGAKGDPPVAAGGVRKGGGKGPGRAEAKGGKGFKGPGSGSGKAGKRRVL